MSLPIEFGMCGRCGRAIYRDTTFDPSGQWVHRGVDGHYRGCRAASYRPGIGWDDKLPKVWMAKPAVEESR